jgi:hypothetical protein
MALQCITCDFSTFGVFGSYYIDNIHPQHARTCIHTYIYDGCSCFFFLLLSLLLQIFFLFFLPLGGERERERERVGKEERQSCCPSPGDEQPETLHPAAGVAVDAGDGVSAGRDEGISMRWKREKVRVSKR